MNVPDGIKNILFDLGGVLLNIDFSKTFDAFAALGIEGAHELNDRPEVLQLFMDLEVGKYSEEGFLKRFRELVGAPPIPPLKGGNSGNQHDGNQEHSPSLPKEGLGWIRSDEITNAFNALLLDFPPERIELVQELGKKYRTFLLSNTNEIHARCYNNRLKENFGIKNLDHLLEKAFYSHELGFRKPDKRIYLKALELAGIKAEETLFFDDNEENVKAAKELGIKGVVVSESFTINELFKTQDPRPKTEDRKKNL